jgi:membrane-associated phospholipid phosphatase
MNLKSNTTKVNAGLVLLFFMINFSGFSQYPYSLKNTTDYSLIAFGALSLTAGQVINANVSGLTYNEINALCVNEVNSFDRRTITNYSENSNSLSEGLLLGTGLASLTLLLDKSVRDEWVTTGIMGLEVLMISYGTAGIFKGAVLRSRPYAYNPNVTLERKQDVDARYSFYSQTTAATAGISFFVAKVYSDTHPNSKWKPLVWTGAIVLPLITGYAKVDAGEHFMTDVMTGYAVGAFIGYFVPVMHLHTKDSEVNLRVEPISNGLNLRLTF